MTVAPLAPSFAADAFREVMAALVAGVSVVTAVDAAGEPRGLTTTAVTAVSADPPLLLVCVDLGSRTLPAIRHSGRFAVNLMHESAAGTASRFASKLEDKFEGCPWRLGRHGNPVLHEDALAWAECRVEQEIEAGDHVVVIGRVEHGLALEDARAPLTYFRRRFGTWTFTGSGTAGASRGGNPE